MTSQPAYSTAFVLKSRSKRLYSHRSIASFVRAKQGFMARIRSRSNFPHKLCIASFAEDDFLYGDERKPLNPYARTFVLLWLLDALAAIGVHYSQL